MGVYTYDYPRPAVTVDLAVFAVTSGQLRVLMVRRKADPFAGEWAFPGGFVEVEEGFEAAARRELREETGVDLPGPIEFIGVFGAPGRDPRGRTISIAHAGVVPEPLPVPVGGDDAAEAAWLAADEITSLAFDHGEILGSAWAWLMHRVEDGDLPLRFLPGRFRLPDLEAIFDAVFAGHGRAQAWLNAAMGAGIVRKLSRPAKTYEAVAPPPRPAGYAAPFAGPSIAWAGARERVARRS